MSEDATWKEIERSWLEVHKFDLFWKIFVAQYFVIRLLLKRFLQSVFTIVLVYAFIYMYYRCRVITLWAPTYITSVYLSPLQSQSFSRFRAPAQIAFALGRFAFNLYSSTRWTCIIVIIIYIIIVVDYYYYYCWNILPHVEYYQQNPMYIYYIAYLYNGDKWYNNNIKNMSMKIANLCVTIP